MNLSFFQSEQDDAWQDAGDKIQRKIFGYNEQVMMVKVKFDAGGIGAAHSHPHTQVTYVESGLFEATIGGKTNMLKAGDGFFVPPDVVHGVVCHEAGLLIDCFAPYREDFVTDVP